MHAAAPLTLDMTADVTVLATGPLCRLTDQACKFSEAAHMACTCGSCHLGDLVADWEKTVNSIHEISPRSAIFMCALHMADPPTNLLQYMAGKRLRELTSLSMHA